MMIILPLLLIIPLLAGIVFGFLISIPLCKAFWEGLIKVRDPSHRVTPRDPWETMTEVFQRRLRWAVIPSKVSLFLLLVLPMDWCLRSFEICPVDYYLIYYIACIGSLVFGYGHSMIFFTILLAPRSKSLNALRVKSVVAATAAFTISYVIFVLAESFANVSGPKSLTWLILNLSSKGYDPGLGNIGGMLLTPWLYLNLMAALAARIIWIRFRRAGNAWFRFAE